MITKFPPYVAPAFNELFVEDDENTSLYVREVDGLERSVTLYHVRQNGVARFDVKNFVCRLFTDISHPVETNYPGWAHIDGRLQARYGFVDGSEFTVLNAVQLKGQTLDLLEYGESGVLTQRIISNNVIVVPKFAGHPVGVSVAYKNRYGNALIITVDFTDWENDRVDRIILTRDVNPHINVEFTPGTDIDVEILRLTGETPLTVSFVDTCVPDDPFYIRWVNRLGGWEYHMFASHKRHVTEVKESEAYAPYAGTLTDTSRTREVLAVDRLDTVEAGEEQLDRGTFLFLSSIASSPHIDAFNVELQRWEGVTVEDKHTLRWDTRNSRGTVNYTFRLIDQNIQF